MSEAQPNPIPEPTPVSDPTPVADPTPAPAPTPIADSAPADYRQSASDGLGEHPVFSNLNTVDDLMREHINLQKVLGGPKIARPAENWGEVEWGRFWGELGRPEDPAGYDLSEVNIPEGVNVDEEWRGQMVGTMHKLGLNVDQVKGIVGAFYETVGGRTNDSLAAAQSTEAEGLKELQQEYGRAFEQRIAEAGRAFRHLAGDRYQEIAELEMSDGTRLGAHPAVIRMMAKLGDMDAEHSFWGQERRGDGIPTPGEAGAELQRLLSDKEFQAKLLNKNDPDHEGAVARRTQLIRLQTPDDEPIR